MITCRHIQWCEAIKGGWSLQSEGPGINLSHPFEVTLPLARLLTHLPKGKISVVAEGLDSVSQTSPGLTPPLPPPCW